jgi:hypothetical protein
VTTRVGRQEVSLGDERLVGAVGWTNTGRSFDGVRILGSTGGFEWSVFWMNVAERDLLQPTGTDPQGNQGTGDDGWLIGGFGSRAFGGVTTELTVLVDRDAVTAESYTLDLRLHGAVGDLLYEAAGAYQFGPDRSAWLASGKGGLAYRWGTLAAQVDYLSGDDDPAAGDVKAFNTLYSTNHKFYGYMDYVLNPPGQLDQAGLVDAMLRGTLELSSAVRLRADAHHFRLARERAGEHTLGTELDVVGTWTMHQYAGLEAGAALFLPADPITTLLPAFAAGSDPTYWGYVQLTVRWP